MTMFIFASFLVPSGRGYLCFAGLQCHNRLPGSRFVLPKKTFDFGPSTFDNEKKQFFDIVLVLLGKGFKSNYKRLI